MLYTKKNEKELTEELFKNPTAEFRGAPFWAWNTKLTDELLTREIDVFKEMGIGGFHMHVRTGMETEYLSDEFMHFVKLCNKKAKKENMLCWLYDEDRWPSGAAGGFVTKNYRYRQRYVVLDTVDPHTRNNAQAEKVFADTFDEYVAMCDSGVKTQGYYLAKFDIVLDEEGYLKSYKRVGYDDACEGTPWHAYICVSSDNGWYNGQAYLDTMSKEAVEAFMHTTYDAYYKAVGEDFGKSIPAIFTDEPQVPRRGYLTSSTQTSYVTLPFTDDFDETYKQAYGESIIEKLPELVWEKRDNACARTRYTYTDHMCERFVSAFVDTLGTWCEEHGIAFTGHMMQEPTLASQTNSLGEAMRCYRNFQIPGMDLLCDAVELTTAKQVQSAVHQYGREAMLSELYGVTGWHFPFSGHKRQGDWQAALGVTVRVHHLTWASMNGDAKHDYPASIGYQSPWYKQYKNIEDHFARVYSALTRGTPDVRVAVIHPIESFWLYTGPHDKTALHRDYLDERFRALTSALCYGGIDFDFISESLLPSLCEKGSNPLKVGKMEYDCVVVPVTETMRSTTLERLKAFAEQGGRVIMVGKAPERVDAYLSDEVAKASEKWTNIDIDFATLVDKLEEYRFVEFRDINRGTRCDNFVHQLRNDGDGKWLFFCHGDDMAGRPNYVPAYSSEKVRVTLNGEYDITEYNTLTGEIYTPSYKIENGKTVFTRTVFTEDSLLLKLTPTSGDKAVAGNAPKRAMPKGVDELVMVRPSAKEALPISFDKAIKLKDEVSYSLDEPNAVLLDRCVYAFDGEEYGDIEDSIRIGDIGRQRFYTAFQSQTVIQPWVPIPEELKKDKGHTVKRKFEFNTDIELDNTYLALELAEDAKITVNGKSIGNTVCGWYVDECIKKVKLPKLSAGKVTIEIETPFTLRSRTEWCYVLGDFGVKLTGKHVTCVKRAETLAYGDTVYQTLPFYTGNITYHIPYTEVKGNERTLQISDFGGALARVSVDGKDIGPVMISPYCISLGKLSKGEHMIDITVFGTRNNGFGPVHNNVNAFSYLGPNSWRTYDSPMWTDNYRLHPAGILNDPTVY